MKILITGAGGMLGRKLTAALIARGTLGGRPIAKIVLTDVQKIDIPPDKTIGMEAKECDLSAPGAAIALIAPRPDCIFHLAAIVSGEAEADFEKGYRVNFDCTRALFEAIRREGATAPYCPRLVFASSLAVFGNPFPDAIPDTFFTTPLSSYGTQKAMTELLLGDYSRRGFLDGIGIRLPTICIRPGAPNRAASGFYSNILREPLAGKEAVLPVRDDIRHWFASPRAAIGFLLHAAQVDTTQLGARRTLTMPGVSATVAEMIEALRRAAGDSAVALIRRAPDPAVAEIVEGWPCRFDAAGAAEMGFKAETSMDEIITVHRQDQMGD